MKRVCRNWFAGFAAAFIVYVIYLGMFGQNAGALSVSYAMKSSKLFAVLCVLSFIGYVIVSKKEEKQKK